MRMPGKDRARVPAQERDGIRLLVGWLPIALLAASLVLSIVRDGGAFDAATFVLTATAAAWVLAMCTLRPSTWTSRVVPMAVYLLAQQALAIALMLQQQEFFIFAAAGFVQSFALVPPRLAIVVVTITAASVHLAPLDYPASTDTLTGAVAAALLQTVLIGWFGSHAYRVYEQNEERRRLVAQLEAALAENDGLHAQLHQQAHEAGIQDERQRLAREIHDTIAQGLIGIITQMQAAERSGGEDRRRRLDHVHSLAKDSLMAARRSVAALTPSELDGVLLPDALRALAARWAELHDIHARVEVTGIPGELAAGIESTLLRVAQEALSNTAKHARATRVVLTLSYFDDMIGLDVRDDGVGFQPHARAARTVDGGFGLDGLRARLASMHGSLNIESAPDRGTAVSASMPAVERTAS